MPKEVVKALELLVRAQKEQFEENLEEKWQKQQKKKRLFRG